MNRSLVVGLSLIAGGVGAILLFGFKKRPMTRAEREQASRIIAAVYPGAVPPWRRARSLIPKSAFVTEEARPLVIIPSGAAMVAGTVIAKTGALD